MEVLRSELGGTWVLKMAEKGVVMDLIVNYMVGRVKLYW